ncbi:Flagellar L-ring protein FlgH [Methylophaga frappieri]|uniref:Flagellar L-ring protein n=1 Tax=Methylophaga frappieri (strain ATCC BAA-2434 / DSM 25690 / JAM7) TaxID=754477 RepID=I1YKM3_METFJ|nr:flagellar basal body L-ring protein FlgH [Methylophaga frappieri]AFJ03466.1 Flagellar L-ring protein FlgH [Methylophaga frappieri]
MNTIFSRTGLLFSILLLAACANDLPKRDPAFAAVRPVATPVPERSDGAIFNPQTNITLYEDYKAGRVGDILTVRLEEQTDAEKETETTISKQNGYAMQNPTVFGTTPQFNLPGALPLASTTDNNLAFNLNSNSDFEGEGESEQNNFLSGNVTVSVVEVLANGNLLVRGEKIVTINQGNEYLRLSGIVSPRDIDADNTVSSIRIADAQIAYTGDGATGDANVMGWLSRFFASSLMPF